MNPLFKSLLANCPIGMRQFLEWYNMTYPNQLVIFQNLPFSHQIGVYLEYFQTIYNLVILVNTKGFTIHFTDQRKTPIDTLSEKTYYHHKHTINEPKSIIYGYELGIAWLFKNYDLPF